MPATTVLEIPSDLLVSARMSASDAQLELALALFARGKISLGKAAQLAGLPVASFQMHLGARGLGPHYSPQDAMEDAGVLSAMRPA
jgi:predicted HTH domain antitoxin